MNRQRRKQLEEVSAILDRAFALLDEIREEEREAFDNLPEGLQYSDRGAAIEEAADMLDDFCDTLESLNCDVFDMSQG